MKEIKLDYDDIFRHPSRFHVSVCMDVHRPPPQFFSLLSRISWLYSCMAISESVLELLSHVSLMPRMCILVPSALKICLICSVLLYRLCTFHSPISSHFGISLASEDDVPGASPCDVLATGPGLDWMLHTMYEPQI